MIMHCLFNTINVLLSYIRFDSVPVLAVIVVMIVGVFAFIMLVIIFCKNNPIDIHGGASERTYKAYKLITKEGYVTLGICIFIFPNVTCFI